MFQEGLCNAGGDRGQRELDDDEASGYEHRARGWRTPRTLLEIVAHGAELTPEAPALVAPEDAPASRTAHSTRT